MEFDAGFGLPPVATRYRSGIVSRQRGPQVAAPRRFLLTAVDDRIRYSAPVKYDLRIHAREEIRAKKLRAFGSIHSMWRLRR